MVVNKNGFLKIRVVNEEMKGKKLRKSHLLNSNVNERVYINHDMTHKARMKQNELRQ